MATHLRELDLAVLRQDISDLGLIAGDVGTVVHVYGGGDAYEVEFVDADGSTLGVVTLSHLSLAPVEGHQILHVRDMSAA